MPSRARDDPRRAAANPNRELNCGESRVLAMAILTVLMTITACLLCHGQYDYMDFHYAWTEHIRSETGAHWHAYL